MPTYVTVELEASPFPSPLLPFYRPANAIAVELLSDPVFKAVVENPRAAISHCASVGRSIVEIPDLARSFPTSEDSSTAVYVGQQY